MSEESKETRRAMKAALMVGGVAFAVFLTTCILYGLAIRGVHLPFF